MKPFKLTFIADTHHYSTTLGTTGYQFADRMTALQMNGNSIAR